MLQKVSRASLALCYEEILHDQWSLILNELNAIVSETNDNYRLYKYRTQFELRRDLKIIKIESHLATVKTGLKNSRLIDSSYTYIQILGTCRILLRGVLSSNKKTKLDGISDEFIRRL